MARNEATEAPDLEAAPGSETSAATVPVTDGPVLEAKELSKWYGDVIAVNDLNVAIPKGITGLLGPNGAGKSTLMRLSVGLLKPSKGQLRLLGEDPWDNPSLLRRIGYLPEGDAPWRERSGLRAAETAGRLTGLGPSEATEAARNALRQVGLLEHGERNVGAYSRGMRQRLKLALALLHDPELLILDEPLLGADPLSRKELIHLIRDLAKQGKSVLVSTHVLPDVEAMTQRILLINHGRLMAHGEVGEIRDLLERYPRTVRIATPRPRELGQAMWGWDTVLSLQAEEGALVVRTKQPQEFFLQLQRLLATKDLPFTSVTSPDDNVEAVFKYLVG